MCVYVYVKISKQAVVRRLVLWIDEKPNIKTRARDGRVLNLPQGSLVSFYCKVNTGLSCAIILSH